MPSSTNRRAPKTSARDLARGSPDIWAVLERLGVDPARHFASLLLDGSDADEKRRDEAAKQLLPYCYARKATQPVNDAQGQQVGYVLCES